MHKMCVCCYGRNAMHSVHAAPLLTVTCKHSINLQLGFMLVYLTLYSYKSRYGSEQSSSAILHTKYFLPGKKHVAPIRPILPMVSS